MPRYDTAVLDGTVVFPSLGAVRCDVGIRDGRIAALTDSIASTDATVVVDARDRLVLSGAVDSHFHIGIYRDLALDAESETASALAGGVTTVVSYFRTGQNYLNKERSVSDDLSRGRRGHHLLGARLHAVRRNAGTRLADAHAATWPDRVPGRRGARSARRAIHQAPRRTPRGDRTLSQ